MGCYSPFLWSATLVCLAFTSPAAGLDRIQSRWKTDQFVHIEHGPVAAGPAQPDWWSAHWSVEPVEGTEFVRIRSRWKGDVHLHIERGTLEAGPIQPDWWSAQWRIVPVKGAAFSLIQNRWKPDHHLHIERGSLEAGKIQPDWWSAQWSLLPVEGATPPTTPTPAIAPPAPVPAVRPPAPAPVQAVTPPAPAPPPPAAGGDRIQNRWKTDQFVHIEHGPVAAGPTQPGSPSAQWGLEPVEGTEFVRIRSRWKRDVHLHIERGKLEAGPIQSDWWSAHWRIVPVQGAAFSLIQNRWKPDQHLHIERGSLEAGKIETDWWSAQWTIQPVGASSSLAATGVTPPNAAQPAQATPAQPTVATSERHYKPGYSSAQFHRKAACPEGTFLDLGRGTCWSCEAGFKRTVFNIDREKACKKTEDFARATDHGRAGGLLGFRCPAGQFRDLNGNCYTCPAGSHRTLHPVTNARACSFRLATPKFGYAIEAKDSTTGAEVGLCPEGTFLDFPRGECWSCPKEFPYRTARVLTRERACIDNGGFFADIASLQQLAEAKAKELEAEIEALANHARSLALDPIALRRALRSGDEAKVAELVQLEAMKSGLAESSVTTRSLQSIPGHGTFAVGVGVDFSIAGAGASGSVGVGFSRRGKKPVTFSETILQRGLTTGIDLSITISDFSDLSPAELAGDTFFINFGGNVFGGVNVILYYECSAGGVGNPGSRMHFFGVVDGCYFFGDASRTPGGNRYLGFGVSIGVGFSAEILEYGRSRVSVTE